METTETDWTCARSYRHPRFVKALSLQLWGFRCARDMVCVHEALTDGAIEYGLSCVPDARTLRTWAADGDWAGEVARMLRSIAPDILSSSVTDMLLAVQECTPWLREVVAGRIDKPSGTRVRATLAVISMVGLPDLLHAAMRHAAIGMPILDSDSVAVAAGDTVPPQSQRMDGPEAGVEGWKARIAARLGHTEASDTTEP